MAVHLSRSMISFRQVEFYVQQNRLDLAEETQKQISNRNISNIACIAIEKIKTVQSLSYNGNIKQAENVLKTIGNSIVTNQAMKIIAWARQGEELNKKIEEEITYKRFDRALDLAWEIIPFEMRKRAFEKIEEAKKEASSEEEYCMQRVKELLQCYEFKAAIKETNQIQDPRKKDLIFDEIHRTSNDQYWFGTNYENSIDFISYWLSKGFFYSALSEVKEGALYFFQVKWIYKDLSQKNFKHASLLALQIQDDLLRNLCLSIIIKSHSQG